MRVSPTLLLLTVLVASANGTSAHAAESCDTASSSQADLNECYGNAYKKSNGELNSLYKRITVRLKDDAATTKLLVAAQKAWVAFRDAECNFSTSGSAQGSVYPMIQSICLDGLTSNRIDDLKSYLKCEEGDLSCPVPAR
jgi:uncharacterized protein YecT (DUF1311 family)